jgi:hypothetical protein
MDMSRPFAASTTLEAFQRYAVTNAKFNDGNVEPDTGPRAKVIGS